MAGDVKRIEHNGIQKTNVFAMLHNIKLQNVNNAKVLMKLAH